MTLSTDEIVSTIDEFGNPQAIHDFLKGQNRTHAHLDWHTPLEWLGKSPSQIIHVGERINGVLSLAPDPAHLHWVRFFCIRQECKYSYVWEKLFSFSLERYPFKANDLVAALCYQNWMETLLQTNGWQKAQKVIVLLWRGTLPPKMEKEKDIQIRKMKLDDLSQVSLIDDLSFTSFWKFSPTTITLALEQSAYSTVAELDGKIVGFQISTADLYRAHLTRLAVLPEYRNRSIGASLVRNMLCHFSVPWIRQITVNTQHDNQASIHLYQRVGFEYLGESFPIFQFPINN
ncbi:MAG: GNAT family N-acetyltransferase [Anaerolineaceae bacterium]